MISDSTNNITVKFILQGQTVKLDNLKKGLMLVR